MVRDGGDDAVDVFAVEEFLIMAGNRKAGIVGDFASEEVAAVVEIGSSDARDARQRNGVSEQAGALHADADHAEANAVAGSYGLRGRSVRMRIEEDGAGRFRIGGSEEGASHGGSGLQEFTTREILFSFHVSIPLLVRFRYVRALSLRLKAMAFPPAAHSF